MLTMKTVEIFLLLVLVLVASVIINTLKSFVDHHALPVQEVISKLVTENIVLKPPFYILIN